jgi:hypothetical protein
MGGDDSQKLLPWRESTSLRGPNLRLNYEINNVTETAAEISRVPSSLADMASAQPAWVIFGKHRWVNSGARRSPSL